DPRAFDALRIAFAAEPRAEPLLLILLPELKGDERAVLGRIIVAALRDVTRYADDARLTAAAREAMVFLHECAAHRFGDVGPKLRFAASQPEPRRALQIFQCRPEVLGQCVGDAARQDNLRTIARGV